jgi:putative thioredoxin
LSSEHVITTGEETFEVDVIDASHERPILVDFWADWCGPCKSVAPVLDNLADELDGKLIVAKVDTDVEQELAKTYGIRSLPTMLLFRHGKPAEQIIGAQPSAEIRRVVEQFLPRPADNLIEVASALLESGDVQSAEARLREALGENPKNYAIHPLLAQVLLRRGDYKATADLIESLPINVATGAEFEPIHAHLRLSDRVEAGSDSKTLEQLAADPENIEARFQLAVMQVLENDVEPALDTLLELIIRHREWNDGAIHLSILDIFKIMRSDDPQVKVYRTRLARTLN